MIAPLGLRRALAGLALEVAARQRQAGAPPVRLTLRLAGTDERLGIEWDGQVLIVDSGSGPEVALTGDDLVLGLCGRPPAVPVPALAPLWGSLFPARRMEQRLVDVW
jgi:hypothetical protein